MFAQDNFSASVLNQYSPAVPFVCCSASRRGGGGTFYISEYGDVRALKLTGVSPLNKTICH